MNKKGFTLVELIIVLAILAIIAAIAVPTAFGAITDAQIAADNATIASINSAIRIQSALDKTISTTPYDPEASAIRGIVNAEISGLENTPQNADTSLVVDDSTDVYVVSRGTEGNAGATWTTLLTTAGLIE